MTLVDTTSVPAFHLKTLMHETRISWVMDMLNCNPRQGQPQVPSPEFEDFLVVRQQHWSLNSINTG